MKDGQDKYQDRTEMTSAQRIKKIAPFFPDDSASVYQTALSNELINI